MNHGQQHAQTQTVLPTQGLTPPRGPGTAKPMTPLTQGRPQGSIYRVAAGSAPPAGSQQQQRPMMNPANRATRPPPGTPTASELHTIPLVGFASKIVDAIKQFTSDIRANSGTKCFRCFFCKNGFCVKFALFKKIFQAPVVWLTTLTWRRFVRDFFAAFVFLVFFFWYRQMRLKHEANLRAQIESLEREKEELERRNVLLNSEKGLARDRMKSFLANKLVELQRALGLDDKVDTLAQDMEMRGSDETELPWVSMEHFIVVLFGELRRALNHLR